MGIINPSLNPFSEFVGGASKRLSVNWGGVCARLGGVAVFAIAFVYLYIEFLIYNWDKKQNTWSGACNRLALATSGAGR